MNMHAKPSFDPSPQPLSMRLGALAGATRALLSGVLRRPRPMMAGGRNDGPPDLDELWRDFNRKLSGLFNNKGGGNGQPPRRDPGDGDQGGGPSFQPDMKSAGIGIGLIGFVVAVVWAGSGFFIVQEGQQPSSPPSGVTAARWKRASSGAFRTRSRRMRRWR